MSPRETPELSAALSESVGLRVPVFARDVSPKVKIAELESYLLLSAFVQGNLAEERMGLLIERVKPQDEWDHIEVDSSEIRTRTEAAVKDAKRRLRPDLFDRLESLDWMLKRISEEIDRLERDASKVSRAYAMATTS